MQARSSTYRAFVVLLLAWLLRTIVPVAPRVEWTAAGSDRAGSAIGASALALWRIARPSIDAESDAGGDAPFACVEHDCCCRTREQCHTACCCIDATRLELGAPVGDQSTSVAASMIDVLGRRVRMARLEVRVERRATSVLTPLSCAGGIPGEMSAPGSASVAVLPGAPRVSKILPSIVPWRRGAQALYSAESPTPLVPPPRVMNLV